MFDSLSERLNATIKRLRGQARLTEDNIKDALREVRMGLLEADVALPVVKTFIEAVRVRAVGQEVLSSLSPGQTFIKIVFDELKAVMGEANEALKLNTQPPAVILLAGLQGAGKTTTAAKLARWLSERARKSVMLVSCDVYRPAAIQQLRTLAGEVGAEWQPSDGSQRPVDIARQAIEQARHKLKDVLIIDTAGRLHVDGEMMDEIKAIHAVAQPIETLFVVDSMTGQDAVVSAKAFHETLPLTGVILTKTDGDARGGAALSVRHITGAPIKFLGAGEKIDALEPFHPDRVASRILGMGDVLTLVEEAQHKVDRVEAEKLAAKLKKGSSFDMNDLRSQLGQMLKMGGVAGMMDKLPGMNRIDASKLQHGDKEVRRMIAIIDSMTAKERRNPDIIKHSRKQRVAVGSGTQVQDINRLLKQHDAMRKMMKKFSKGGLMNLMRGLGGRLPFGP